MASVATAVMDRLDLRVRKAPQESALFQILRENAAIVAEGQLDRHAASPQRAVVRLYKCDDHNHIPKNPFVEITGNPSLPFLGRMSKIMTEV